MAISLQSKPKRRTVASVSMAPMIDMVFLLLVFFMTASAMSQAGSKLELDLPDSPASEVAKDFSGRLILSIDDAGRRFIGTREIDAAELSSVLGAFRENEPGGKLNIRAAKSTPFSAIKETMRIAATAGIDDYLYATYQAGAGE